jgi:hypothetical protein
MSSRRKEYLIYALHHDDSSRLYVGRSSSGLQRAAEHGKNWYMKGREHYPVVCWINKLRSNNKEYEVVVLEKHTNVESLNEAERFYIAYFRSLGVAMLNCTDGGDGISGYAFSAETRAEMSRTRRGRPASEDTRRRLAVANKGKKMSADAIARTRAAHLGKKRSAETCLRLAIAHRGKTLPATQRAKISAANLARWAIVRDKSRPKLRINLLGAV